MSQCLGNRGLKPSERQCEYLVRECERVGLKIQKTRWTVSARSTCAQGEKASLADFGVVDIFPQALFGQSLKEENTNSSVAIRVAPRMDLDS